MDRLNKSSQISNNLILAKYNTTTAQRRIVYAVLMQIEKVMEYTPLDRDPVFEVPKHIVIDKISNAKLHNACTKLLETSINIPSERAEYDRITPFRRITILKDSSTIDVVLDRDACKIFYELKKGYSKINYQSALQLQSTYAQRLYEYLSMKINGFEEGVIWTATVEEFREITQVEGKYKLFADLKRIVLDTAVNAVNEHTDIKVQYELSKKGRSFHYIEFYFSKRNKESEFDKIERAVMDAEAERIVEELNKMNITDQKMQEIILRDHRKAYAKWKYQVKTKQVTVKSNYGGHLLATLGLLKR